jgi:hypothetical protein
MFAARTEDRVRKQSFQSVASPVRTVFVGSWGLRVCATGYLLRVAAVVRVFPAVHDARRRVLGEEHVRVEKPTSQD